VKRPHMARAYHLWGIAENPRRCGERKATIEAEDWVDRAFETSCRREFSDHMAVLSCHTINEMEI